MVIFIHTCRYSKGSVVKYNICLAVCKFSLPFPPPPRYSRAPGKKWDERCGERSRQFCMFASGNVKGHFID